MMNNNLVETLEMFLEHVKAGNTKILSIDIENNMHPFIPDDETGFVEYSTDGGWLKVKFARSKEGDS